MIAANVWHWWLGAGLAVIGIASVLGLVVGYLKKVTAMQHPTREQRRAAMASRAPQAPTDT